MSTTTETTAPATALGTPGPWLPRLFRGEVLKLSTTSMWWWFALGTVLWTGVALGFNIWTAVVTFDNPEAFGSEVATGPMYHASNIYTSGQFLGLMFVMLIGIVMVTSEYHHQTATTTFLTTPHRTQVVWAKLLAAVLIGVLFWAFTTAIALVGGAAYFSTTDYGLLLGEGDIQRSIWLNLVAFVVWAILGIAIGTLITSQLAATLIAAAVYLIGTQVASLLFMLLAQLFNNDTLFEWQVVIPSIASTVMVTGGGGVPGSPDWWVGAVVLLAYAVVAGFVGVLLTRKRDVS